jgi:hypothetical protein
MKTINKEKPILFNTTMIQSIEAGLKTRTSRVMDFCKVFSLEYSDYFDEIELREIKLFKDGSLRSVFDTDDVPFSSKSKYQKGDTLWVRETWSINSDNKFVYKAQTESEFDKPITGWKPAIHLPLKAARIFLKVTDVKADRLQNISESEAISEGICRPFPNSNLWLSYTKPTVLYKDPRTSFESLWISIYGEESWESNPWIWSYEFQTMEIKKL